MACCNYNALLTYFPCIGPAQIRCKSRYLLHKGVNLFHDEMRMNNTNQECWTCCQDIGVPEPEPEPPLPPKACLAICYLSRPKCDGGLVRTLTPVHLIGMKKRYQTVNCWSKVKGHQQVDKAAASAFSCLFDQFANVLITTGSAQVRSKWFCLDKCFVIRIVDTNNGQECWTCCQDIGVPDPEPEPPIESPPVKGNYQPPQAKPFGRKPTVILEANRCLWFRSCLRPSPIVEQLSCGIIIAPMLSFSDREMFFLSTYTKASMR